MASRLQPGELVRLARNPRIEAAVVEVFDKALTVDDGWRIAGRPVTQVVRRAEVYDDDEWQEIQAHRKALRDRRDEAVGKRIAAGEKVFGYYPPGRSHG